MKKLFLALILCISMTVSIPAQAVMAENTNSGESSLQSFSDSGEISLQSSSDAGEISLQSSSDADAGDVKTLVQGLNTVTEAGTYQFTPRNDGFYICTRNYTYDSDGITCYCQYSSPVFDNTADISTKCYLQKGKTYEIKITAGADGLCSGTVKIALLASDFCYGENKISLKDGSKEKFMLVSACKDDVLTFSSDVPGNLDVWLYSEEDGYVRPASGANDVDPDNDDYNFNVTYNISSGYYMAMIITSDDLRYGPMTGTYTISHKYHKMGDWSADTATALKTGTQTGKCLICGVYKETRTTARLKPTVKLSAKTKTIRKGKNFILKISNLAKGDAVASVKSSKKTVAIAKKVAKNKYRIIGRAKGKATFTVTLKSGKKATCKVTVKK